MTGLWGAAYAAGTSLGPLLADQFMELKVSAEDDLAEKISSMYSLVPSLPCTEWHRRNRFYAVEVIGRMPAVD